MRTSFTIASIATIAGCSLFGFDGFSGGDDPASSGEGGTTSEAGGSDGDANVIGDGGSGGDGAPSGPFCKTVGADASVCDDFEEPGTFTGKWPEQDTYLGALEVKDGIGFGGTRGLAFSATPVGGGGTGANARVVLGWRTPVIATWVDAEVAVKMNELPPTSYLSGPLVVRIDDLEGGYVNFGFELEGATGTVATNPVAFPAGSPAVSAGYKAVTTLKIGEWTRLRLVVDLGKSPPALYSYVDGSLKNEQALLDSFVPERISVRLGAQFAGSEDGGTIRMDLDDARIDWK